MLFYEPLFLLVFLPLVLGAVALARGSTAGRLVVLLAFSVAFYLWAEPVFVPVVILSCAIDHFCGVRLARAGARAGRFWLAAGVASNALLLVRYKYAGFAADNLDALLVRGGLPPIHAGPVALPVGVSFIVFEKITYLVDIARGRSRPAPGFSRYLLYVFLFPKLLAGPILKYHDLEAQIAGIGGRTRGDLELGFERFLLGVVKKLLVADTLAAAADRAFAADPQALGRGQAWWGVLCFTFQIYVDFSAYSDMAIGLARMLGFRLPENFNRPYVSGSVTEFWRRWHISLSTWIRDYLYIPLGGNRVPVWRRYANLWTCFLLSGLWHGAAWTFVGWGAYNGVWLVLERLGLLRALERLPFGLATAWTFLVTMLGWTLFRASSFAQARALYGAMLIGPRPPGIPAAAPGGTLAPTREQLAAVAVACAISFLPRLPRWDAVQAAALDLPASRMALRSALLVLFVWAFSKAVADPFRPFLYFRF